jgi:hypothetical protein
MTFDSRNTIPSLNEDAKLIALGDRLDGLLAEYARSQKAWDLRDRLAMQALRKMPKPLAWEDIERTHKEFEPAGIRSPEDVMNDLDAPARRIRRLPAKTLSGDREGASRQAGPRLHLGGETIK